MYSINTEAKYNKDKRYSIPQRSIVGSSPLRMKLSCILTRSFNSTSRMQKIPEELPYAYRSCCLKIGACIIVQKAIDKYKHWPMLQKQFGKNTGLLLELAAYLIIDEENAGQYYPDYAFTHPLFSDKMKSTAIPRSADS